MPATNPIRLSDYSLVGKDTALAIEKGLAEATWYASPVPKDKMRELLRRQDGPAIRDTIIWFALIIGSGVCRLPALAGGQLVGGRSVYDLRRSSTAPLPTPAGTSRATARPSKRTG